MTGTVRELHRRVEGAGFTGSRAPHNSIRVSQLGIYHTPELKTFPYKRPLDQLALPEERLAQPTHISDPSHNDLSGSVSQTRCVVVQSRNTDNPLNVYAIPQSPLPEIDLQFRLDVSRPQTPPHSSA